MIGRLQGVVVAIQGDSIILDVQGVGYEVFVSQHYAAQLTLQMPLILFIETHVREDHIHLHGFASKAQQDWFRILNKVNGVGAKLATAILGQLSVAQLEQALLYKERHTLLSVSGVGPKLADRLLHELKDKALDVAKNTAWTAESRTTPAIDHPTQKLGDVIAALMQLGYKRQEAEHAATSVMQTMGDVDSAEAVKAALQYLTKKETV